MNEAKCAGDCSNGMAGAEVIAGANKLLGQANRTVSSSTPLEAAQKAVDDEIAHRKLIADQSAMMTMLEPHFTSTWVQLSEGLFKWFRYAGFWPKNYGPHLARSQSSGDGDSAYITLSIVEYTRLKKAEKIALIHSELSEMLDAVRKDDWANEAEKMADVQIRMLDYCGGFGIQLGRAFHQKMLKNYKRPVKHGKEF